MDNYTNVIANFLGLNLTDEQMSAWKKEFEEKYNRFFIEGDWSVVGEAFKTIGHNIIDGLIKGIEEKFNGLKEAVKLGFKQSVIGVVLDLFQIHSPSRVMQEIGNFIVQGFINGINSLIGNVPIILENMKQTVLEKFENMKNGIGSKIESIKNNVTNWTNDVKSKISDCWENCRVTIENKVNGIKSSISSGLDSAGATIKNWGSNAKETFSSLASNASRWGKDLAENMANGIRNSADRVTSAVSNVAGRIKSFLHFTEPDEGPLSNFHTYMPDMIDLMVSGIRGNTHKLESEIKNLAGMMTYTINTDAIQPFSQTSPKINSIKNNGNILNNLEDILLDSNSNYRQPVHVTIQYLGKEIYDDTIDYINSKTRRTGKNTIITVGD